MKNNNGPSLLLNQAADAIVLYLDLEKPLGQGATRSMVEAALERLVDQYEGTRVSHILWNICYQRAAYRSKAWASYWDVKNPDKDIVDWPRLYYELHLLGIDDVFSILIPRCREKGISPWVSLRMNDMHYNDDPNRMNPFWNEHPEFHISGQPGFNNGFDFTKKPVRDHYMKLIDEALSRWNIAGIELDWMRKPNLCKPDALDECREDLSEFMRTVHEKTLAADTLLAVRVPARPEYAFGQGLDAVAWAHEGLIDYLIPSSYWRPSFPDVPVEAWREKIGRESNCKIIPATDLWIKTTRDGVVTGTGMTPIRGFTVSMIDRGADGIYLFNHFAPVKEKIEEFSFEDKPDSNCELKDLLTMAGDPDLAAAGPRRHILTYDNPVPADIDYCPPLPFELINDNSADFKLHIGPVPEVAQCILRVGIDDVPGFESAKFKAEINKIDCYQEDDIPHPEIPERIHPAGHYRLISSMAPRMLRFSVPNTALKHGYNQIRINLCNGKPQKIIWLELYFIPNCNYHFFLKNSYCG